VAYNSSQEPEGSAETRDFTAQIMLFAGSINPALPAKFRIVRGLLDLLFT
jgi:hypothetical protein